MTSREEAWAETVLRALSTRFPYAAGHVSLGPTDVDVTPEQLHPAFHGSLDWHSSAHMQWSAMRLLDRVTDRLTGRLTTLLDERLTGANLGVEADYLRARPTFERPYGWAWLATLARYAEHAGHDRWAEPLAEPLGVVLGHLERWLPRLAYPVRHGVHANTAFALALIWDACPSARPMIVDRALEWFGDDDAAPVGNEPSGEDFLSPALCEADLMRRVLPTADFVGWLGRFLPALGVVTDPLLRLPVVHDRTDGKAVHLFGLALSRAAQLRRLAPYLPDDRAGAARAAADTMSAAVRTEIDAGHFMSTHWLVSFALLADDALGAGRPDAQGWTGRRQ